MPGAVRYSTRFRSGPAVAAALAGVLACAPADGGRTRSDSDTARDTAARLAAPAAAPSSDRATIPAAATAPEDGQWIRPARDYASSRYSGLSEINTSNVAQLRVVGTFSTGVLRGQEAAPIVANNTMYVITPFPNYVYALDLTKPGYPVKWTYKPKPLAAAQGVACCDVVNRGVVYADGKIILNTLDNHTIAVDANTGQEIWRTRVGDINLGESLTMAPLVVKDRVLVGNSGGEFGVRGWLTALDLESGKLAWRAYGTGPDRDVLIGARFHPFYGKDRGPDLGVATWPGDMWKIGGAGAWGWISYDPALDLVYYGTSNPGPWNPAQRPGDNKWSATLFARDPETGEAVWAYQITPHDLHDYDGVNESLLLDVPWQGRVRQVLIRPERNGYLYMIDRATGEVLYANPFGFINSTSGVDLKTGRLLYAPDKEPELGKVVRDICPASPGVKDWQPSSFSPRTGYVYIPHQNLCMDVESVEASYIAGTPYVGMNVKMKAGPGGHRGELTAWDPVAAKPVWIIKDDLPIWSGTVVTAGDVVFYGTMDGWFKAIDARTGTELWKFKTGSGIIGQPVTYRGPDGKQYVAVLSGVGGWAGGIVAGGLDARDSSAALGFVNAMKDLPARSTKGGMLYVFALP